MFKRLRNKDQNSNTNEPGIKKDSETSINKSLDDSISVFTKLFKDDDTFVVRRFENRQNTTIKCCIMFIAQMVDNSLVDDYIIKPVVTGSINPHEIMPDNIMYQVLTVNNVEKTSDVVKMIEAIVSGNTVLFIDGYSDALVIPSVGWKTRSIQEPEGERVIRGPREGFTESLMINLTMVRRRLATNNLKFKIRTLGVQSRTKICICYIEGIANGQILKELNERLDKINIDIITGSGMITELIKDAPLSPFKTIGSTERPDIITAKLLEGRIAVIVDGSPVAMTLPYIFIEAFQSNEDYYINFYFSSINRLLRMLSFFITISLPAVYVALTTFHQEMIPTPLIRSIAAARQNVPFPTVVEVAGLLLTFELLREAGTRMPINIGQALSIVGALVLGQSAVEARLVSSPVVIIVALTAICGLILPRVKGAEIIIRTTFLFLSSLFGLYGYIFGIIGLMIHLFQIRTFGVPYMLTLMNFESQDIKDTAIRVPWFYMKLRPKFLTANNRVRNTYGGNKK